MRFTPRKTLGIGLGLLLVAVLVTAMALSIAQLGQGVIAPVSLLWIAVLLLALPLTLLVLNRMYGLVTAAYRVDRDGFYIRWGLSYEQVPLDDIMALRPGTGEEGSQRPSFGFWWPGCMVGSTQTEERRELEFFATTGSRMLVETRSGRALVITPPDPQVFQEDFFSATRMGSLEMIQARSERPNFLLTRLWADRTARALILTGMAIPLSLLGVLVLLAPSLPAQVPFGFGPSGEPQPLAPPGRLLLLPMIGGLIWLADLLFGSWFYTNSADRPVAYALWGASIVAGVLLVGAAIQLLSA